MKLKSFMPWAVILCLVGGASAALNGTELSNTVSEAFIVLTTLLNEVAGLVPTIISVSIQFAVLGAVVGFFALMLYILRAGIGKGLKM
jgi:hypothetical protein